MVTEVRGESLALQVDEFDRFAVPLAAIDFLGDELDVGFEVVGRAVSLDVFDVGRANDESPSDHRPSRVLVVLRLNHQNAAALAVEVVVVSGRVGPDVDQVVRRDIERDIARFNGRFVRRAGGFN